MDLRGFEKNMTMNTKNTKGNSRIQTHTTNPIQIGVLSMAQTTIPIESREKDRKVESHTKDRQDGKISCRERVPTQIESQGERPSTTRYNSIDSGL
jgi:hypothetical protein